MPDYVLVDFSGRCLTTEDPVCLDCLPLVEAAITPRSLAPGQTLTCEVCGKTISAAHD